MEFVKELKIKFEDLEDEMNENNKVNLSDKLRESLIGMSNGITNLSKWVDES